MISEAELELQKGITTAFILADAEEVVLNRPPKVSDGAGGFRFDYNNMEALAEAYARMIPQNDRTTEYTAGDGRRAVSEWIILMEADADIKRYDRFVWRGVLWEVAQVHTKPDYETKGDVIRCAG